MEKPIRRDRPHEFDHVLPRLRWLSDLGFQPETIVDVGASDGGWTVQCAGIFPSARYLCVEPLLEYRSSLEKIAAVNRNVSVYSGCLGAARRVAVLNAAGVSTSLLPDWRGEPFGTPQPAEMTTLDDLHDEGWCRQPDLLKIDVQGYELEVLRGAERVLKSVSAVLVEVSFLPFHKGMPVFHDVVAHLAACGFALADILSLSTRPLDGSAAQSDVLFVQQCGPSRFVPAWDKNSELEP